MEIQGVDPNHYSKQGLKFHPIKFAGFCFCAKCKKLVEKVETEHPNGLDRGPWIVNVYCCGLMYSMRLSEEAVKDFVEGNIRPVPTLFFKENEPRPLSRNEILKIERKGAVFALSHHERQALQAQIEDRSDGND